MRLTTDMILAQVKRDGHTGCWIWQGRVSMDGYPIHHEYRPGEKMKIHLIHRMLYRAYVGEIPNRTPMLRTCRNKRCINVEHLRISNYSEVLQNLYNPEATKLNRQIEMRKTKKITFEIAQAIRKLKFEKRYKHKHLAQIFGIGVNQIQKIVSYRHWKKI